MLESDKSYLAALHMLATVVALIWCVAAQGKRTYSLPYPLTPGAMALLSVVAGSIAAHLLDVRDYVSYLTLWTVQVAGMILGLASANALVRRAGVQQFVVRERRVALLAGLTMGLSILSAVVFFGLQGIPALGGDIEQGRVDAAASGTGYLRLMAYMAIPASTTLVAIRSRLGVPSALVAFLILIGLANRSPLLYLLCPLALGAWGYGLYRLSGPRVIAGGLALVLLVAGIGGYRVISQEAFYNYAEYSEDLASGNYAGVALTALTHYAGVVPSNAVLTKNLVDSGELDIKLGETYFTLFISALPGEQLSLDREIKELSGKDFIGGGTPPTLMGEGYANFWYFGTFFSSFFLITGLCYFAARLSAARTVPQVSARALAACVYGFFVCWTVMAQVAGLAGASTFPVAAFIFYMFMWRTCVRNLGEAPR